jgi:hypothetical protein
VFLQSTPIIVKLIEPAGDPTGLADVLLGALGLTGVLAVTAITLGLALGGIMFWLRSRSTSG